MSHILIVDDEALIRAMLARILSRQGYTVSTASSVQEGKQVLDEKQVDLCLCDLNMPGASGIELVQYIAERHANIATVMITGVDNRKIAEVALQLGVYGYIIKPFEANEILINVSSALKRRELELENQQYRHFLESLVEDRTKELQSAIVQLEASAFDLRTSREETIQRLAMAAEFRSDETARHIKRMSLYCELLARRMSMDPEEVELIRIASPMHDIGKLGTPDSILMKPGKLSVEEFEVMKQHAEIGYRILKGSDSKMLQLAAIIARYHHERWDGKGYPTGIGEDEIPIQARICSIADVFDALTSKRCYKPAYTVERTREIMFAGRGTHFDANLLDLFWTDLEPVMAIQSAHQDSV